jgi:signal peptidase I
MKEILLFFWEIFKIVILALLIVIPIRYFLFQPFVIKGNSMEPNFHQGDYLIVDEISYRFSEPKRGDVIVFRYPRDTSQRFIKRIIGLPGETIKIKQGEINIIKGVEDRTLDESEYGLKENYTDNLVLSLKKNEYFVLGDNRTASFDSRKWGALSENYIIGKVILRTWFPSITSNISNPLSILLK